LIVGSTGVLYPSITAQGGSVVTWISDSNITNLVLQTSSGFDASQDVRKFSIAAMTIDGDTCRFTDPNNRVNPVNAVVNNAVSSGPFVYGTGRTEKIT
jgi:ABC-type branched-subunit amino acid transport system substrate-binding protein